MLRKNVAGQFIYFAGVNATTGAFLTGATFSGRRALDGTFAAIGGTISEDTGTGFYKVALTQADTNGDDIAFFFTATNAVPICMTVLATAANPSDAAAYGLTNLDAAVSSRMATYTQPSGFLAATFPGTVASTTNISQVGSVTGAVGSVTGLTAAYLDVAVSTRAAPSDIVTGGAITVTSGAVDADIKKIAAVTVSGIGTAGNPWGPA